MVRDVKENMCFLYHFGINKLAFDFTYYLRNMALNRRAMLHVFTMTEKKGFRHDQYYTDECLKKKKNK